MKYILKEEEYIRLGGNNNIAKIENHYNIHYTNNNNGEGMIGDYLIDNIALRTGDDNDDDIWNFIISKVNDIVILQLKTTQTFHVDSSGSIIIRRIEEDCRTSEQVKFIASGYIDNNPSYHNLFSIVLNPDGSIEIKNVDNTTFKKDEIVTLYPTTFVYHKL
jgi:hypothetical protein